VKTKKMSSALRVTIPALTLLLGTGLLLARGPQIRLSKLHAGLVYRGGRSTDEIPTPVSPPTASFSRASAFHVNPGTELRTPRPTRSTA